jgi:hypothetical protein
MSQSSIYLHFCCSQFEFRVYWPRIQATVIISRADFVRKFIYGLSLEFHLLRYYVSSPLKVKYATRFMSVSCLAYSSTMKMETTCSSETSTDFQPNI